jgi:hypothetical protein
MYPVKRTYMTQGDYLLRVLEVSHLKNHTRAGYLFSFATFEVVWNYGNKAIPVGEECTWIQLRVWDGARERFASFAAAVLCDSVYDAFADNEDEDNPKPHDELTSLMPGCLVICNAKEVETRKGNPYVECFFRRYNPHRDPRDADPIGLFPQDGLPCCQP